MEAHQIRRDPIGTPCQKGRCSGSTPDPSSGIRRNPSGIRRSCNFTWTMPLPPPPPRGAGDAREGSHRALFREGHTNEGSGPAGGAVEPHGSRCNQTPFSMKSCRVPGPKPFDLGLAGLMGPVFPVDQHQGFVVSAAFFPPLAPRTSASEFG